MSGKCALIVWDAWYAPKVEWFDGPSERKAFADGFIDGAGRFGGDDAGTLNPEDWGPTKRDDFSWKEGFAESVDKLVEQINQGKPGTPE